MGGGLAAQKTSGDLFSPVLLRGGPARGFAHSSRSFARKPAAEARACLRRKAEIWAECRAHPRADCLPSDGSCTGLLETQSILCITDDLERLLGRQHHDGDQLHARIARWRRRTDRYAIVAAEEDR